MNRVLLQVIASIFAITILSADAGAKVKVKGDLSQIRTVAMVGYSFWRHVPMHEDDSEYAMMEVADERVLEAVQALGTFNIIPREDVLANEFYQSSTKDPSKKLGRNWYFPKGYREVKLKKKNAVALCEALGVDAVMLIEFEHANAHDTVGVLGHRSVFDDKNIALKGEITMFDRTGKTVIAGSAKSEGVMLSMDRSRGDQDKFWSALLSSFLEDLQNDLR
ncbi:MAG: hypothetical protein OEQ14_12930 [Gammaproteobacteria bacterium]|nr:hypothetical protein [Gammaproteobacteria bacterium]